MQVRTGGLVSLLDTQHGEAHSLVLWIVAHSIASLRGKVNSVSILATVE